MAGINLERIARNQAAIRRKRARVRMRRRPSPQTQPDGLRRAYYQEIRKLMRRVKEMVDGQLVSILPELVAEADQARERGDSTEEVYVAGIRMDALPPGKRVNALMDRISEALYSNLFQIDRVGQLAAEYARRTNRFAKEQLGKQIRSILGVDVPLGDPKLGPLIRDFTAENVGLIRSLPQAYLDDVEKRTLRALSAGTRATELAKELAERYAVSESRAELIANDQIGKFFGAMNEAKQTDLGVDAYIWRTSGDNRVRDEHVMREGKRFLWSDPPADDAYDGHPGIPINCRCYAEPDLSPILEEP